MLFGIEFNQKHVVSTLYKLLGMFAAYKMQTFFLRDNAPAHTVSFLNLNINHNDCKFWEQTRGLKYSRPNIAEFYRWYQLHKKSKFI